jgi:hypothetical protein
MVHHTGYSKRLDFSPAHPLTDIFHPPYPPIALQSMNIPQGAQKGDLLTRPTLARQDVPFARARAFRFPNFPRGSRQIVLHCAHRATTALSWGLCEQEERSACSLASF